MRWCHVGAGMVVLMLMTGCPTEFGKDGRINKAVRNDMLELTSKPCDPDIFMKYCYGGKEDTPGCREKCR